MNQLPVTDVARGRGCVLGRRIKRMERIVSLRYWPLGASCVVRAMLFSPAGVPGERGGESRSDSLRSLMARLTLGLPARKIV